MARDARDLGFMTHCIPFEQNVHTVFVPEDFIERLARCTAAGELFPEIGPVRTEVLRQRKNYLRLHLLDPEEARRLHFNIVEVWRQDRQTILYRVGRETRLRELRRSTPALPFILTMVPVFSMLAFLVPGFMLVPVFGAPTLHAEHRPHLNALGRRLKEIADGQA